MVDYMKASQRRLPLSKFKGWEQSSDLYEYSSINILSEELGIFISSHDLDFLSNLTNIYNAPPIYSETRRGGSIDIEVFNPQITWLVGTQPAFLSNLLPEEAWGQGTMSRVMMVYSAEAVKKPLFGSASEEIARLREDLLFDLNQLLDLYGEFTYEASAQDALVAWYDEGMPPIPKHTKLIHYVGRRAVHIIKLCMIASIARTNSLIISLEDFETAKRWLLFVEEKMPDIFRDMVGKSDKQVMDELHFYMYTVWRKSGMKEGISKTSMNFFLSSRIPSEKIGRLISAMEASNMIARVAGTELFIPRPHHEHGVE